MGAKSAVSSSSSSSSAVTISCAQSSPTRRMLAAGLLMLMLGVAQSWPVESDRASSNVMLLKKSDAPQWEDLGWAWGKKRAAPDAPQWDDLGWSWGKRSAPALGATGLRAAAAEELIERARQQLKRRDAERQRQILLDRQLKIANRVMRSAAAATAAVKQSPDWHDLGWAWGRRK